MTKPKKYKHAGRVDFFEPVPEPKKDTDWAGIAAAIFWAFVILAILSTCSG